MRSRSPVFLLVVCIVATTALATTAQRVQEECRQGVGDELIWEYDVRRPQRSGGYQVRVTDYVWEILPCQVSRFSSSLRVS